MANLRELIAASLQSSDLSQSPLIEAAIDRVGALAFTDPLGAELWRLMAHQANAYERVVALLAHRGQPIVAEAGMRRRICVACVHEFMDGSCRTCGGTGYLLATATAAKRLCPTCEGSRQRRYSDLWRARQLGLAVEVYRKWDRRYGAVFDLLGEADRITYRQLAEQLERILPKVLEFRRRRARLLPSPNFAVSTATL